MTLNEKIELLKKMRDNCRVCYHAVEEGSTRDSLLQELGTLDQVINILTDSNYAKQLAKIFVK